MSEKCDRYNWVSILHLFYKPILCKILTTLIYSEVYKPLIKRGYFGTSKHDFEMLLGP